MHGGAARADLTTEDVSALEQGTVNLERHVENLRKFGVPVIVAINRFAEDSDAEIVRLAELCEGLGVPATVCTHFTDGGGGALALAEAVIAAAETPSGFHLLYADGETLWNKTQFIARSLYGADDIIADKAVRAQFRKYQNEGDGHFPICMAKTQYSFSTDPNLHGAPVGHVVPVREIRLAAGAEFLVVICGGVMTMPGLPRVPSATGMAVDSRGQITGLS